MFCRKFQFVTCNTTRWLIEYYTLLLEHWEQTSVVAEMSVAVENVGDEADAEAIMKTENFSIDSEDGIRTESSGAGRLSSLAESDLLQASGGEEEKGRGGEGDMDIMQVFEDQPFEVLDSAGVGDAGQDPLLPG